MKSYREQGLTGLADPTRSDKGTPRSLPQTAIRLVEGLALQTPPRSAASIHRQVTTIATEQGWKLPSYARVLHRLLMQIERILEINELQTVTKEVVEEARTMLVLGQA